MKMSEFMSVLEQSENGKEFLCKVFPFSGGPWIGMTKIKNSCRLILNSYGVNGGTIDVKDSEIQNVQVLDVKSEEARAFLKLVNKEHEAEEIE